MFRKRLPQGWTGPRGSHAVVRVFNKTGERARASIPHDVECLGSRER